MPRSIETSATPSRQDSYVLNGTKVWTTFGQIADVFLSSRSRRAASVRSWSRGTDRDSRRRRSSGVLGTRASMLANLRLDSCAIPKENRIGGVGFGLSAVGSAALDIGRYSVACGCVGIAQACLDASIEYASARKQYGALLERPPAHPKDDHRDGGQRQRGTMACATAPGSSRTWAIPGP